MWYRRSLREPAETIRRAVVPVTHRAMRQICRQGPGASLAAPALRSGRAQRASRPAVTLLHQRASLPDGGSSCWPVELLGSGTQGPPRGAWRLASPSTRPLEGMGNVVALAREVIVILSWETERRGQPVADNHPSSAIVAQRARDADGSRFTRQVLVCPLADCDLDTRRTSSGRGPDRRARAFARRRESRRSRGGRSR